MVIHKLTYNGTSQTIEEPIGYDDLKTKISRSDLHGISVEVSVGDLEFYGVAFDFVKDKYESDIDSIIVYSATDEDGTEIYSGTLDLSTYSETCGDYCSIKCKVGDVGAKTTFNNRTDTEVDLNGNKTIDGSELDMQASWDNVKIPLKHLKYTNSGIWKADSNIINVSKVSEQDFSYNIPIVPSKVTASEFGTFVNDGTLFKEDEDFDSKYGENTICDISGVIDLHVNTASHGGSEYVRVTEWANIVIKSGSTTIYAKSIDPIASGMDIHAEIDLHDVSTDNPIMIMISIAGMNTGEHGSGTFSCNIDILKSSNIKMTMYDNIEDSNVYADMINVHNALNVITGTISENALSVKSDWFGGWLSTWNRPTTAGGGHLKAITNGYKIRGLFTEGDTERNMPVSFKSMINSLNALDCIGWGFSKEDGIDFVRVERWGWFYKDDVLLTISGANEITLSVNTDKVVTDLQIGFKKYETASTFNSIDSVHGERSMKNSIKVVEKKISQLCEFVGDTYCIEETRRAKEQVDPTESFKYDENTFIFELGYKGEKKYLSENAPKPYIPNNVAQSTGVERPLEQYNVQLSPRRCAERWRSFLFAPKNNTPYRFISGKINYKAGFKCNVSNSTAVYLNEYLADFMGGQMLNEDADMAHSNTIFKAESLKFKYPITLDQYKTIMANPYGLISVNGIKGWIKEMQYTFATGEADFTLIPRFEI